jgi:hypothetical protein
VERETKTLIIIPSTIKSALLSELFAGLLD